MKKNTTNQNKYTGFDAIESEMGYRRAHMKQLERIENALLALIEVSLDNAPANKKKGLAYKIKDLLDDGKLNDSVNE